MFVKAVSKLIETFGGWRRFPGYLSIYEFCQVLHKPGPLGEQTEKKIILIMGYLKIKELSVNDNSEDEICRWRFQVLHTVRTLAAGELARGCSFPRSIVLLLHLK